MSRPTAVPAAPRRVPPQSRRRLFPLGALALGCALVHPPVRAASGAGEAGRPLLREFTAAELPVTQAIAALAFGPDGLLYLGSSGRVIEYDGHRCRDLLLPEGPDFGTALVGGLQFDPAGRLFFATPYQVGFFQRDAQGEWRPQLVNDAPPGHSRPDTRTIGLTRDRHGLGIVRSRSLARWHDGQLTGVPLPDGQSLNSCLSDDQETFVLTSAGEFLRVGAAALEPVARFAPRQGMRMTGLARMADGRRRIVFESGAVVAVDAGGVTPLWTGPESRSSAWRSDGRLVVATPGAGLRFFDAAGGLEAALELEDGLPSATITNLLPDRAGRLWLATETSVALVDGFPAATRFDRFSGLAGGPVAAVQRHAGILYVAADDGVYRLDSSPAAGGSARFHAVGGLPGRGHALAVAGGTLFAGSRDGVYMLRGDTFARLAGTTRPVDVLIPAADESTLVYYGTGVGLGRLRQGPAGWNDEGLHDGLGEVRSLAAMPGGVFWVGPGRGRVIRATAGAPARGPAPGRPMMLGTKQSAAAFSPRFTLETFEIGRDLPGASDRLQAVRWGDAVYLAAAAGLLRRNDATARFESLPADGMRGYRLRLLTPVSDQRAWVALQPGSPDSPAAAWRVAEIARDGSLVRVLPAAVLDGSTEILCLHHEAGGGVLWVGTREGLLRIVLDRLPALPPPPRASLSALAPAPASRFPAGVAALRFDFAAPDAIGDRVAYQTRLGPGEAWSAFSPQPFQELQRPASGRYELAVRARNRDGAVGPAAAFAFTVLPPWWLSGWAALGYSLAGAAGVAGLVRWRLGAARRRNRQLEEIVATRTRELHAAKLGAESASQAKSAFLANMSHELRTPLNAILGYAQILRRETGLSETGRRQLGIVGRNGEHLLQMINEVLDLAKIEAGKMTLHAAEFPLSRVLKTAADLFEQRAADKGLAFRLEFGARLPKQVSGDEAKLRQVLFNLLGNAVKFTERGEVALRVSQATGDGRQETAGNSRPLSPVTCPLRFEVRDTGPGIAAGQLEAVFEPFHQANPGAGPAAGTGLGLPISRRIVELFGGSIQVESQAGRGSRFWFEIALQEVRPAAPRPTVLRTITGYEGPRRRILIVDDEPANRAVLRDLLEPLGFEADEAADGAGGVAAAAAKPPDALLLDLRMPVLGGLGAVARIRGSAAARAFPIIAVSASVLGFNQDEAIAAGCDAFLAKPVQEAQLLDTLGRLLGLAWTWRESAAPSDSAFPLPADAGELPGPGDLAGLSMLARRGDLNTLRDHVARALARGGPGAAFLRELDALGAAFQTAEIRRRLADARARQETGAAPP